MQRKHVIIVGITTIAALGTGAGVTYAVSGTQSNTGLSGSVTVDGHKALDGNVVAGRIKSKFHPLPWVGQDISSVSCPTGLKAVAGATITCTAKADGKGVEIPVSVVKASGESITWKFER